MNKINPSLDTQIFNAPTSEPLEKLDITVMKQLGAGAQAEVFQVKIKQIRAKKFVDKSRKITNNEKLAEECLKEMFGEFCIAKDLLHPNIVEYKYFMRNFNKPNKSWEFHIIMELMGGEDMDVYLRE